MQTLLDLASALDSGVGFERLEIRNDDVFGAGDIYGVRRSPIRTVDELEQLERFFAPHTIVMSSELRGDSTAGYRVWFGTCSAAPFRVQLSVAIDEALVEPGAPCLAR